MKVNRAVLLAAATAAASFCAPALAAYEAPDPAWNAPASYYNAATGTGFTLRTNLNTIVKTGFRGINYGNARYWPALTDRDPNNSSNILLAYNRASVSSAWDGGVTWNREHIWPQSLLNLSVDNNYTGVASDCFELRPCDDGINSTRSNYGFGYYVNNNTPGLTYGLNSNGGTTYWNPGQYDRGDMARAIFYMATRWFDPTNPSRGTSNSNLELKNGAPTLYNFGDLNSMLHWHYTDGIDNFERRRNHYIYSSALNPSYYQGNRNPFVDRPEYVWAIWGPTPNNSQIAVGAPAGDGSSSLVVNPRLMRNGTIPAQNVSITKTGTTPTTYDLTVSGDASTTAAGTGQPFDYNAQTRSITVSMTSSTATTGLKVGTVTINNTDLTSAAAGQGLNDGNDIITINAQVVDDRTVTATAYSGRVIAGRSLSIPVDLTTTGDDDHYTRITVPGTASSPDANGASIAAGAGAVFNSASSTATRSISANFAGTGAKSGTLNFAVQGEGLAGESVNPLPVSYSVTAVNGSEGSFDNAVNLDAKSIDFEYVPQGFARSASFGVNNLGSAADTAALDIDSVSVSGDAAAFSTNVGPTGASPIAAGSGNSYTANLNTSVAGTFAATHTIAVSDEDIPGAASGTGLALGMSARVLAVGNFPVTGTLNLLAGESWDAGPSAIGAGVTVTKAGPGMLTISGAQTHGANSTLLVSGGALIASTDAGSAASAPLAVGISAGSATFSASQHLRSLTLGAGTSATMSADGGRTLYVNLLDLDASAKLDLNDNDLVVQYGTDASPFAEIRGLVFTGYSSTPDAGKLGIISSSGQLAGNTILAVLDNAMVGAGDWPLGSGNTIDANSVIGKYTYFGDANIDGMVTSDDYAILDGNLNTMPAAEIAWLSGDANLDGSVTSDDYAILDGNIGLGMGNPLSAASMVPEPGAIALAVMAMPGLLRRRRR